MLAIAGGLGVALVGWIMVIGLLILVPFAIGGGLPGRLDARSGAWMVVSGIGDVVGLLLAFRRCGRARSASSRRWSPPRARSLR